MVICREAEMYFRLGTGRSKDLCLIGVCVGEAVKTPCLGGWAGE